MNKRPVDILLDVISPDRTLVHRMVSSVDLPGAQGRFEVLKNHGPLISSLVKGDITYTSGDRRESLPISSGFVEICDNHVSASVEV